MRRPFVSPQRSSTAFSENWERAASVNRSSTIPARACRKTMPPNGSKSGSRCAAQNSAYGLPADATGKLAHLRLATQGRLVYCVRQARASEFRPEQEAASMAALSEADHSV